MANIYLDLCFEILFVYTQSFGKPPKSKRGPKWLGDAFHLIHSELQALFPEILMEEQLRKRLTDRFINRFLEAGVQMELLSYLQDTLEHFTSLNQEREPAFNTTNSCLFIFLRLMDEIYGRKKK
jgi:hypothetical protein